MSFMFVFLMLIPFLINPAEEKKIAHRPLGKAYVTIEFLDEKNSDQNDATIKKEYPIRDVKHFNTIKNMLEDLDNTGGAIPLAHIKKNVFDFLIALISETQNNAPAKSPIAYETAMFKLFISKKTSKLFENITFRDLLLAANYLDVSRKIKSALAYGYVETTKTKIPQITVETVPTNTSEQKTGSIDEFPRELEPLIAGWLLYDILTSTLFSDTQTKQYKYNYVNPTFTIVHPPVISRPAAQDMFSVIWKQPINTIFTPSHNSHIKEIDVVMTVNDITIHEKTLIPMVYRFSNFKNCALSDDGKHLLIIDTRVVAEKKNDVVTEKTMLHAFLFPNGEKIEFNETTASFLIHDILFNIKTQSFIIIALRNWNPKNKDKKKQLWFYEIKPKGPMYEKNTVVFDISDETKTGYYANIMHWSCIGEDLVGVLYTNQGTFKVLVYKQSAQQIYKCQQNGDGEWFYETDDGGMHQQQIMDFTVANIHLNIDSHNTPLPSLLNMKIDSTVAIQSFIPHFATILEQGYVASMIDRLPLYKDIDWQHLRINHYGTGVSNNIGAQHFFGPKLGCAIQFLNKKIYNGQNDVYIDALFLHGLYNNINKFEKNTESRSTWLAECEPLLQYLSPEIREIYKYELQLPATTIDETRSLLSAQVPTRVLEAVVARYTPHQTLRQRIKQNISEFLAEPKKYLQRIAYQYQNILLGAGAAAGVGLAAWLVHKSKQQVRPFSTVSPVRP